MRFALPALLLASAIAPAAPVPDDLKGDKPKLESFWNDLAAPRWVDRARAVYDLLDHPKGVEFLAQKVVPVSASADDLKKWLKAINSDDEKVWKPALAELEYHDPRTALTAGEQIEQVDTDAGKKRLMRIWFPRFDGMSASSRGVVMRRNGNQVECEWLEGERKHFTDFEVPAFPGQVTPTGWQRAALAAHLLHRADTKTSRAALARMADGHAGAPPTKLAADLLKANPPEVAVEFTDTHWHALRYGGPAESVAAVVALREAKNVPAVVKPKLPPIKASKEQLTKWLRALESEDNEVWGPAQAELSYFRPSLALTLREQFEVMTSDTGRLQLFNDWTPDSSSRVPRLRFGGKVVVTLGDDELTVTWLDKNPPPPLVAKVPELSKQTCVQWQRARLAIVALERNKSDEAKAVLKQLADGHPDILPTKEAKAALERLKGR